MAIEEDKIFEIEDPQPLFVRSLQTLPLEPAFVEIRFQADGIAHPNERIPGDEDRYLMECTRHKVLPHSGVNFSYSHNDHKIIAQLTGVFSSLAAFDAMFDGGKPHSAGIKLYGDFDQTIFAMLIKKEYHIDVADIWFWQGHSRGYDSGDYSKGGIYLEAFDQRNKGRLRLKTGWDNPEEEVAIVNKWFNDLTQESKAVSPQMELDI